MRQGLYEQLINTLTKTKLAALDPAQYQIGIEPIDPEEARKLLSTYIAAVTRRALKIVREQSDDDEAVLAQVRTCNDIIATLRNSLDDQELEELRIDEQGEILTYVYSKLNSLRAVKEQRTHRPATPLSQSSLFTGSHSEPNMMSELQHEIVTSDRIDLLVSFIKWSGLRILMEQLEQFTANGGQLRVITTTYMEATDYKAIELASLYADVITHFSHPAPKLWNRNATVFLRRSTNNDGQLASNHRRNECAFVSRGRATRQNQGRSISVVAPVRVVR